MSGCSPTTGDYRQLPSIPEDVQALVLVRGGTEEQRKSIAAKWNMPTDNPFFVSATAVTKDEIAVVHYPTGGAGEYLWKMALTDSERVRLSEQWIREIRQRYLGATTFTVINIDA